MREIFITQKMIDNKQEIPLEYMPDRADSATNLLLYIQKDSLEGLLVLNYSPDVWKTWYPVFEPINKFKMDYKFKAKNYKQLIDEYEQLFIKYAKTVFNRKQETVSYIKKLYNLSEVFLDDSFIIQPQYWLKYSKTQNKWTIYRFEFFIVKGTEPQLDLSKQTEIMQDILPLNSDYTNFKGLPVVENMIKVIEDKEFTNIISKYKVNILY